MTCCPHLLAAILPLRRLRLRPILLLLRLWTPLPRHPCRLRALIWPLLPAWMRLRPLLRLLALMLAPCPRLLAATWLPPRPLALMPAPCPRPLAVTWLLLRPLVLMLAPCPRPLARMQALCPRPRVATSLLPRPLFLQRRWTLLPLPPLRRLHLPLLAA